MNETLNVLETRRSLRAYDPRPVEREKLEAIRAANAQRDGSLVMGNLMNAAWSLGVSSCWINRAEEVFAGPEGKALLRRWGLPEGLVGVGNCVLGYAAGGIPAAAPRKADFVKFVD